MNTWNLFFQAVEAQKNAADNTLDLFISMQKEGREMMARNLAQYSFLPNNLNGTCFYWSDSCLLAIKQYKALLDLGYEKTLQFQTASWCGPTSLKKKKEEAQPAEVKSDQKETGDRKEISTPVATGAVGSRKTAVEAKTKSAASRPSVKKTATPVMEKMGGEGALEAAKIRVVPKPATAAKKTASPEAKDGADASAARPAAAEEAQKKEKPAGTAARADVPLESPAKKTSVAAAPKRRTPVRKAAAKKTASPRRTAAPKRRTAAPSRTVKKASEPAARTAEKTTANKSTKLETEASHPATLWDMENKK